MDNKIFLAWINSFLLYPNGKRLTLYSCQRLLEIGYCVLYKNGEVRLFEEENLWNTNLPETQSV